MGDIALPPNLASSTLNFQQSQLLMQLTAESVFAQKFPPITAVRRMIGFLKIIKHFTLKQRWSQQFVWLKHLERWKLGLLLLLLCKMYHDGHMHSDRFQVFLKPLYVSWSSDSQPLYCGDGVHYFSAFCVLNEFELLGV